MIKEDTKDSKKEGDAKQNIKAEVKPSVTLDKNKGLDVHVPVSSANVIDFNSLQGLICCDMGQNDTIGKIELNPSFVLSSDETNCKNDIQLFHQLFDELSVNRDYH